MYLYTDNCIGHTRCPVVSGRPQRMSAETGGGGKVKCGHMRTGGGGKEPCDVRNMALFQLFHHDLQTLPMGDAY